jgi:hypothetical protein
MAVAVAMGAAAAATAWGVSGVAAGSVGAGADETMAAAVGALATGALSGCGAGLQPASAKVETRATTHVALWKRSDLFWLIVSTLRKAGVCSS